MSKSKRAFIAALNLYRFLFRKETGYDVKVPLWQRFQMLRRGFLSVSYILYDGFRKYDRSMYFSDYAHTQVAIVNGRWEATGFPAILDNKIFFSSMVGKYVPVSPVYAYIERGRVFPLDDWWRSQPTLRDAIASGPPPRGCGPLVFKPVSGMQGQGILFIDLKDGQFTINGKVTSEDEVNRRVASMHEYIVSGFIKQGEFPSRLYPHSTNTIRVLTICDVHTQQPFIAAAVHRIGTAKSAPLDNWSRGGLAAAVDIETGRLGPATRDPVGQSRLTWFDTHPDTGAAITGERLPGWDALCDAVLAAASALPYLKFVGWDIILTDDGICALEANPDCGVRFLQVHRPLLLDPRVREFFEHHRLIKPRRDRQHAAAVPT